VSLCATDMNNRSSRFFLLFLEQKYYPIDAMIKYVYFLLFLLALTSCSGSPADPALLSYEQSLSRADSLVQSGTMDSAGTACLLSDLHREYTQIKEHSGGKRLRLMPSNGRERLFWGVAAFLQAGVVVWLILLKVDVTKDRKHRRYIVSLSENEQRLRDNEREMAELEAYLEEMPLTDEMRDEVKESLINLTDRTAFLRGENDSLRLRLKDYEKRPLPCDVELLEERGERIRLLDEQVQALTVTLIDRDDVVLRLRRQPKFLSNADWEHLRQLADRVYNGFTERLALRFPQLTPADQQLCLLMRLRFTNAQVATLIAVSPASVSQQKFRLKKRLMQAEEGLFKEGETLDGVIWNC